MAVRQQAEVDRLQRIVDRFGAKATKAAMAHSLEKRIERIQSDAVTAPKASRSLRVKFPQPPQPGRTVLEVDRLAKSYGALDVFDDVTFDVGRGERLLILGLNGAGKTSLLRILAGVTTADTGTVRFGHNVSVGYYAQEHEGITAGGRCSSTCASRSTRRSATRPAPPARHVRAHRRESPPGRVDTLPAGRRRSWRSRSSWRDGTTCSCSTNRPTTSTRRPRRDRSRARRVAGNDDHRQPRQRLRSPARARSGPADARGRSRLLAGRPLDLVELADAVGPSDSCRTS